MTEGYIRNKETGATISAELQDERLAYLTVCLGGSTWSNAIPVRDWDFIEGEPPVEQAEASPIEQASMLLGKKVLVHRNHGDRNYALIEVTRVEKTISLGVVVHGRIVGSGQDGGYNFSRFTFEEVD